MLRGDWRGEIAAGSGRGKEDILIPHIRQKIFVCFLRAFTLGRGIGNLCFIGGNDGLPE